MKIFLDTRDLINLFQNTPPERIAEIKKELVINEHELVLSLANVLEISAPLITNGTDTNVMRLLNSIEEFPVNYIRPDNITRFELAEACKAIETNNEYTQILPFVKKPADLFDISFQLINASIAELIFTLWLEYPDSFRGANKYTYKLEGVVGASRQTKTRPPLSTHFREVVSKHFLTNNLKPPAVGCARLADWIYEDPNRCPSVRLGNEIFQKFERNNGDRVKKGDIYDYSHIDCLPYVDIMTLERRMAGYVRQADASLGTSYASRICSNIDELMGRI